MKYTLAYFRKSGSDWMINGGKLVVTDQEFILKNFIKTVARFCIDRTTAHKIPDYFSYKGISISDGFQCYCLYFFPKTAEEVYRLLRI